jgi:hypothetical protein
VFFAVPPMVPCPECKGKKQDSGRKLNKYLVTVQTTDSWDVVIAAESEEVAEALALNMQPPAEPKSSVVEAIVVLTEGVEP